MAKEKTKKQKDSSYEAKDIYVLEGLEPVRKRPGMYIGTTGSEGLHHLIWECVDNSLDEAMAGYAKNIEVVLLPGNKVKTIDDGRGIPVDKHPQTKKSALETVMTTLHAGAKFGGKAYQVAGGLHGVGVSVVCALSKEMTAEVCRDGIRYNQEYARGKPKTAVKKDGKCRQRGTTVCFEPDPDIFSEIKFDLKRILNHLRQQAYLTRKVRITVLDQREKPEKSYTFYFEGGVASYVKHLTRGIEKRQPNIYYGSGEKNGILVEAAFQYTDEYECFEESFANNIYTGEGGTHLTGFRTALTRTFNDYAKKNNLLKNDDDNLSGEDVREGFTGVISVKLKEPQFEGQTKAKLGNPEVKTAVESVVSETLADFLERNPQDARAIIEKCILSSKARKAAKAARETVLRKGILEGLALPGKLADCTSKNPAESELYIVEGESAGGCWSGDTKIALTDGRNISFKELVKEYKQGKKNFCYTIQDNGHIGIAPILNPRMTKKNAKVIKIILDNGEELMCTPDHLFRLADGSYVPAAELTPQHSLAPLYRKISKRQDKYGLDGYEMVFDSKAKKWMYAHILADMFNLKNGVYTTAAGKHRHHVDFNKLNNNPTNVRRLSYEEHMNSHYDYIEHTLLRPDVIEKSIKTRQTKEHREKIRKIMTTPEMRKMLSERAKKQWEHEEYKQYMVKKFLEFYKSNKKYREKNGKILYENQKTYWLSEENRKKQSEKTKRFFSEHQEAKDLLSEKAKIEWNNPQLLAWRSEKTKEQWTPEFRIKRKIAYNNTYQEKGIRLMREIFEKDGKLDEKKYNQERLKRKDKSVLRYETICHRFFGGSKEALKEAVANYNHKIKKIIILKKKINVYDLEVEGTHNFALASGVFVHNSGKQARDRRFQAILPLRGKILNVERARLDKILESKEIRSLIIALGTAIAEDFNLEKLRYHRIIIMSDADVDGAHIRTLLLTLFYRHFPQIIEKGYLYIAQPPLYKIQTGKQFQYAYTEEEKDKLLAKIKKASPKLKTKKEKEEGEEKISGVNVQRYKGLGEMNPEELWTTTMSPEKRVLLKVNIEDVKEADRIFDTLMGDEVLPRKKFIQTHAKKVRNLDI
jgi:DNA gyrase subunit B